MTLTLLILGSLALGLAAPGVIRPFLRRLGLVDVPNHRSSHTKTTLRGGGIAVMLTVIIGAVLLSVLYSETALTLSVACGTVIAFGVLGLLEDVKGLPVRVRLLGQFGLAAVGGVLALHYFDASYWWLLLLVPAGIFLVNAANFMDGTNGISGFHGVLTAVVAVYTGVTVGAISLALFGVGLGGAFAGFLPWNFPRAKMFLGDVGSYLLGSAMWVTGIWVWFVTGNLLLSISPVAVYSIDVIFTLIRRAVRRVNLTEAHREHVYQRVHQAYSSHVRASGYPAMATALIIVLAVLWQRQLLNGALALLTTGLILAGYMAAGPAMERKIREVK